MKNRELPEIGPVRNIAPSGRVQHRKNREQVEKTRLKQRNYGFQRYGKEIDNILETEKSAPSYMTNSDRLQTNACGEEKTRQDNKRKEKLEFEKRKRETNTRREQDRVEMEDEIWNHEQNRVRDMRDQGSKAKRNADSEPYDIISLKYNDSLDGVRLYHADQKVRYRSKCRARNLDERTNGNFNPITGAVRPRPSVGNKPKLPAEMVNQPL